MARRYGRRWRYDHPLACGQLLAFPTCSRRLTVTRVRRCWSWPGRANVQRVTPISGTLLIPVCHGCVSQRYSRVNPKPRQPRPVPRFTEFPQREWGHSARSGTVLRGDRNASPSLLLGGLVPPRDYAMTLFPLLPRDDGGSLRRPSCRVSATLLTLAALEWIRDPGGRPGRKAYPLR
jgi:hypothetical protein